MYGKFQSHLQQELKAIDEAGLYKRERIICSPQGAEITLAVAFRRFEGGKPHGGAPLYLSAAFPGSRSLGSTPTRRTPCSA